MHVRSSNACHCAFRAARQTNHLLYLSLPHHTRSNTRNGHRPSLRTSARSHTVHARTSNAKNKESRHALCFYDMCEEEDTCCSSDIALCFYRASSQKDLCTLVYFRRVLTNTRDVTCLHIEGRWQIIAGTWRLSPQVF